MFLIGLPYSLWIQYIYYSVYELFKVITMVLGRNSKINYLNFYYVAMKFLQLISNIYILFQFFTHFSMRNLTNI